jgi:hypothetical protein
VAVVEGDGVGCATADVVRPMDLVASVCDADAVCNKLPEPVCVNETVIAPSVLEALEFE